MKRLLNSSEAKDIDLNFKDSHGGTAYLISAQTGNLEIMKMLEEWGIDKDAKSAIGGTVLHEGVLGKKVTVIKHLISMKTPLNIKWGDGYTPLALAIMNTKDVSISRLLLEAGADPNIVSKEGVGPLFFAIKT